MTAVKPIMRVATCISIVLLLTAAPAAAKPAVSLIEQIEKSLRAESALKPAERLAFLNGLRHKLAGYAFDVLDQKRSEGARVLMSVVAEGSSHQADLERTISVAVAAYVAVRRGAPAEAVAGIALYGFRKKISPDLIRDWANGYAEMIDFQVSAPVAQDLIYNAAENDWDADTFRTFKWALVAAVKAGHDPETYLRFMVGHALKGDQGAGAISAKAKHAFQRAALVGSVPTLPAYKSPVLDREPVPPATHKDPSGTPQGTGDGLASTPPSAAGAARVDKLISTLESFLGTPYVWGGRTRRGTDCSGLSQAVYASVGIELGRRVRDQYKAGRKAARTKLRRGDLVFFVTIGKKISHVGVVTDGRKGEFIHGSSSRGVVRSLLKSNYYRKRYAGARRVLK